MTQTGDVPQDQVDEAGGGLTAAVGDGPRILIAAPCDFGEFPIGGYTTFVRNILPSLGPDVLALGIDADEAGAARSRIAAGQREVDYLSAGVLRVGSKVPQRIQIARMTRKRCREVREWRPQVVYSHTPDMTVALASCLRGSGVPIVHHMHGSATDTTHSPHAILRNRGGTAALTWLLDEAVRRSCLVLGVSQDCVEVAERNGRHARLVPTCVDTDVFHPIEKAPQRPAALRIVSVGRIDGVKNLQLLVRAVRVLVDEGVDASATIGGDGPSADEVRALADELGLTDRMTFVGRVHPAEAARLFAEADVAALTSLWEGLPTAMLEAMACGTPVVAPSLPGIAEVVTDGENGILFEAYEPAEVAAAIVRAGEHAAELSAAALETVRRHYSAEVVGAEIDAILLEVAAGRLPGEGEGCGSTP